MPSSSIQAYIIRSKLDLDRTVEWKLGVVEQSGTATVVHSSHMYLLARVIKPITKLSGDVVINFGNVRRAICHCRRSITHLNECRLIRGTSELAPKVEKVAPARAAAADDGVGVARLLDEGVELF